MLCFIADNLTAQFSQAPLQRSDANIIGHVLDKHTGEHLSYITITLRGTTIGTVTDATGHYFLKNLPEGEFVMEVSSMGYKTVQRPVTLKKGITLEEDFEIEEDAITLDGVVVSANRNETTRRMAPTLVNVVDMKLFESTNSATLSQGLNFQPGVRVETNCQNCGFQQVRINGLDGPYTQILIDSRPIFSALAGVYGLEQIPASMIERVEVMRGGGSALFGSSAIAGTINIITKEPLRNSGQLAHTLTSIGNKGVFDNNTSLNASLVTDDHKAGLYIFGQNRHRSAYDADGDGFSELPQLKNQTVGMRSYFKTSTYSKLTFEYHHMQEFRRGGDKLNLPPHEADIAEQLEHSIDGGGLKFDYFSPNEKHRLSIFTSAQYTDRDSYYGPGEEPLNAYGKTTDMTFLAGTQYIRSWDRAFFMPADLTVGIEYNRDNLEDNMWGYERYLHQIINIGSAFVQNEWKNDRWGILIGGRFDKHSLMDHLIFSPRANLRFNPTPDVNLRVSYASGFRAPQAFDEDLHVENVGGNVAMIERDPNLKEERSHSLSVSADMYRRVGAWQFNLLVEGFYTRLKDVFVLEDTDTYRDGVLIRERRNGSGARVMGLTLEGKAAWLTQVQIQAGATLQRSRYDEAETWSQAAPAEKKIMRTPDLYGYFTATYTPAKPLSVALSGTYTGKMLVPHFAGYIDQDVAVNTSDFWDIGMKVAYDFKVYRSTVLQLNAGIQNIFNAYQKDFDKGADRDSGYIYGPAMPRSYYAGFKISY
ncbi:MAG: TonB-dependent receptor [Bacteroides sp.]|nr:TonB-dependent receptor [Bacteroides sp.]